MRKREDIPNRLVYTCNCGWVDKELANPTTQRRYVGAQELWNQLVDERGEKVPFDPDAPRSATSVVNPLAVSSFGPEDVGGFRSRYGFRVTCRHDMSPWGISGDVSKEYLVRCNLSVAEKKSVALAIFTDVDKLLERLQGNPIFQPLSGSNSMGQEDLVSHLIGFYTAVNGKNYLQMCKPVSTKAALQVWDALSENTPKKVFSYAPLFYPCEECKDPKFPTELTTIAPALYGADYRNWDRS